MFEPVSSRLSPGGLKVCHSRAVAAGALAVLVAMVLGCSSDAPSPAATSPASSTPFGEDRVVEAKVVNVIDGATIEVELDGRVLKVRYLGIEVPDVEDGGPSLGDRAVRFNAFLVEGRTVELERGITDMDGSGRLLRYVYVDGEMVNKAMLTNGYATVAAWPDTFQHRTDFAVAEESAKRAKRGYWEPESEAAEPKEQNDPTQEVEPFFGGTLPLPPELRDAEMRCDFSEDSVPVIKGNIDTETDDKVYHVPGGFFYGTTVIEEENGDRWFAPSGRPSQRGGRSRSTSVGGRWTQSFPPCRCA